MGALRELAKKGFSIAHETRTATRGKRSLETQHVDECSIPRPKRARHWFSTEHFCHGGENMVRSLHSLLKEVGWGFDIGDTADNTCDD